MARAAGVIFALTILLSAFLLFAVQPIMARFILPWFGGAAAVWTTCLLFFQALLLGGYAYAHLLAARLSPRTQMIVHVALLGGCLLMLPILPPARLAPTGEEDPTLRILLLLTASVGLPYFALSATSPLVQHWYARRYPGRSVYRLYALSNAGSLAALISYPFVIEPLLARRAQSLSWSWLFAVFALASALSAIIAARRTQAPVVTPATSPEPRTPFSINTAILVLLLTMLASTLLLAVTNKICQEIAPFPFLWVLPLTLYLIAFIVCFEYPRRYHRGIVLPLAAVATLATIFVISRSAQLPLVIQIIIYAATLFLCCFFCLGETVRRRPAAQHLTRYYLIVALGGVLGAVLVTIVGPLVFNEFLELHLALLAAWLLALGILLFDRTSPMRGFRQPILWLIAIILLPLMAMMLYYNLAVHSAHRIQASRSFYGVMKVIENRGAEPRQHHRELLHNGTTHGMQFMHEDFRRTPTSYYGETSGVGLAMRKFRADQPRRIGIVGLGAGTLAAYGKAGDTLIFYELDPEVVDVARTHFTFLADTPAKVKTIVGDARLSLARQENQHFDILVLDAFSGDAVPVHLLTVEAFELYRRHLAPGGVIAIHLSNRHLYLVLPAYNVAKHHNFLAGIFRTYRDETPYPSEWLLATDSRDFLESLRNEPTLLKARAPSMKPWTDDHAPLFPVMRKVINR